MTIDSKMRLMTGDAPHRTPQTTIQDDAVNQRVRVGHAGHRPVLTLFLPPKQSGGQNDMINDLPKIWFLRHGETYWNAERRIQGQLESELTEQGVADAHKQEALMAPILNLDPPCYVSPLGRAQQTARIALAGRSYTTDDRLAEAHAGAWQGLLHDDVRRDFPGVVNPQMSALELFLAAPGGEGMKVFQARILDFLNELHEPSVVVAHGLLGQVIRGLIQGLSLSEMGQLSNGQGCVYVLENGSEAVLQSEQ